MLNGLDLFSGIGGLTVALAPWVRPVAYCEIDQFAQAVLLSRMATGDIPIAPIWDDIRTLRGDMLPVLDIVYGGSPCQPYSSAARGRNPQDELSSEFVRIIEETKPKTVFGENTSYKPLEYVARRITGYQSRIVSSSAAEVGCPFIGRRYWLVAEADSHGKSSVSIHEQVARMPKISEVIWETFTPENIRVDDGLPHRVYRLGALGNGVAPLQARKVFQRETGSMRETA